ncbi:hypothetical protein C7S16_5843 [Burkholderia thailandensis]|uniref:Uncharacterized protein n=1 Tax=Burkholderia thailandensis TaxID=57975 RepID=A0AAW9CQ49_BURTH|nr:hypothetical protein [Burkholderia thailandensis]MDW9251208.1 hypothetical protein [Burkholderia thailandensis]
MRRAAQHSRVQRLMADGSTRLFTRMISHRLQIRFNDVPIFDAFVITKSQFGQGV